MALSRHHTSLVARCLQGPCIPSPVLGGSILSILFIQDIYAASTRSQLMAEVQSLTFHISFQQQEEEEQQGVLHTKKTAERQCSCMYKYMTDDDK
mmetsp:Transcript_947/g.1972  ORF Transcript_947/g.1972 Transcript_947/m.1972 type:complete len:95 (-) Transcript_947:36-320(-)